jgi:hypothetical protein
MLLQPTGIGLTEARGGVRLGSRPPLFVLQSLGHIHIVRCDQVRYVTLSILSIKEADVVPEGYAGESSRIGAL